MSLALTWSWKSSGEDPAKYLNDVYRYCRARQFSREDAEDIAMEVVHSQPARTSREDLRAYMIGIARRKIAGRRRSSKDQLPILESDTATHFADQANESAVVESVLGKLTEDQREALTLRFVIGLTSHETALALAKSPEAVDSLVQRAKAAFAREWDALSGEEVKR